jgi:hypothetical protein
MILPSEIQGCDGRHAVEFEQGLRLKSNAGGDKKVRREGALEIKS